MASDIRPFGAGDGRAYYWVQEGAWIGRAVGCLRLVMVDETGQVYNTPQTAPWDDSAMTRGEAVQKHLGGAIADADRELERRRREAPEPKPKPPPLDYATQRFLGEDG